MTLVTKHMVIANPKCMTRGEAVVAMIDNHKVTHRHMSDDEYIYLKDGQIFSEDGACHGDIWDFFAIRRDISWKTDWSIFSAMSE